MAKDATLTPAPADKPVVPADTESTEAKARFAKAVEEARGGAAALGSAYKDKLIARGSDLVEDAKTLGAQAKERAAVLAGDGKGRATSALSGLGRTVSDNAGLIDDKLGVQYGDYARGAGRSIQDAAERIDAKSLDEIGEDMKNFVRQSPGLAVGLAAVAGFMLARMFRGSDD